MNKTIRMIVAAAAVMASAAPAAPASAALNLDVLSAHDIAMVRQVVERLEPLIRGREAEGTLATLTFEELYTPLGEEEREFLKAFETLDPAALNVRIPFRGVATGAEALVRISGQRVFSGNFAGAPSREIGIQYLPEGVYRRCEAMMAAMEADLGTRLLIESGYRSSAYQLYLFVYYLQNHAYSIRETVGFVALPGYSEHGAPRYQAVDFMNRLGINGEDDPADFEALPEYRWLLDHAAAFGFVLSYPRVEGTGITFEPWHWRCDACE